MRYVALWRGINVGKAKRLAMADLRALLVELGATNVSTLLNSGNAVFDTQKQLGAERLRAAVLEQLGVDAAVILKTAAEWTAIAARQPIAEADDPSRLLVAITADAATLQAAAALAPQGDERLVCNGHAAYLWCAHGVLQSKTAVALLKQLGEAGTTRNWATVEKLRALLAA
ncbi:MAG: DUF1697 domain-containing protein [Comamonadaceae bacterium]|jgi:uncharacterized protein (DUF1697 family)|nr:DUF1697 domain-containing protein [Comamonadaceae bacterium]